ncbi:MAG: type II secretion system protein GspG [Pirellulales bacterium]
MQSTSTKRRQPQPTGFTLMEVLLVLVILGVIAALVVPRLTGSQERALVMATQNGMKALEAKLELYAVEHMANYPENLQMLLEPVDTDGQAMKPYETEFPKDAWEQPLNYELTFDANAAGAAVLRIWSNGPNRQNDKGSGDDINNWDDGDKK